MSHKPPVPCGTSTVNSRYIVPYVKGRDFLIAVGVGLAILAFLVCAFVLLSHQAAASGGVEGTITAKNFFPQQETQITVGREGVSSRQSAGEYSFQVRGPVENNRVYKVTVDPLVYNSHAAGDRFYFVRTRPPAETPAH